MANILTNAARHAKVELLAAGIEVGHAKLQEVMAALLGYHTYRALKLEEDDQELEQHLSDAEFIVLDQELGQCRAAELFELPGEVLPKCIAALEECLPAQILPSVVELQKTNVLLTHEKAGRSGLLLRGVKPVKGSRTGIQCTRMDVQVQRDDGSVVRPWAVAVLDIPSGITIGSAVSLDDTPDRQAVNALTDALNSTALRDNEGASENEAYGIIQLDIGDSFNSERFKRIASEAGIESTHYYNRTNPVRGQIEALFHKISRSIGMKQPNMHRLKPNSDSDSERMTIEDLKQLFKKS
ncbi:hypothetical protein H4C80_15640 [Pseudomonas juntendi]|uniref:Uncharacterized protein n=1 Tax=Pseudomonas juntendi TaxID=2666183 RepID=A0A7W2KHG3_9PSED|nr:hypothetical protein [Pseudomonas juntendi]MBA6098552.1 hypothetical protein [Pseudomonas juntendi]